MILKQFRALAACAAVAISTIAIAAPSGSTDEAVLAAYDAYRAGDAMKLARYAKKLEGHVLQPWLDYWRVAIVLDDASAKDVHAFFAAHGNTYAAEVLRADWLRAEATRRGRTSTRDHLSRDDLGCAATSGSRTSRAATSRRSTRRRRCGSSRASCPTAARDSPTRCGSADASPPPTCGGGCACCSRRGRSPRRRPRLAIWRKASGLTSASSRRRRAGQAHLRPAATLELRPARGWRCSPACASRARTDKAAAARARLARYRKG